MSNTTWVETLTKLMTPEYTKLFPTLFDECSGCNGTGWSKINLQFGAHETVKCASFKCDGGVRRKTQDRMLGVLVRIYGDLFPDEWVVTFREDDKEPEETIAKAICMRVALINYTGKSGDTT